jgi:hypothetical protein
MRKKERVGHMKVPRNIKREKERKRKIAHIQEKENGEKENGERLSMKRISYTIHQKYPHTCTSCSRFMTCFSFGSVF